MRAITTIVLSLIGGVVGAYLFALGDNFPVSGATVARTTITNPWTFASTTIFSADVTLTTTNTATSSAVIGCVTEYSTSTATASHKVPTTATITATTTFEGTKSGFYVVSVYGTCP